MPPHAPTCPQAGHACPVYVQAQVVTGRGTHDILSAEALLSRRCSITTSFWRLVMRPSTVSSGFLRQLRFCAHAHSQNAQVAPRVTSAAQHLREAVGPHGIIRSMWGSIAPYAPCARVGEADSDAGKQPCHPQMPAGHMLACTAERLIFELTPRTAKLFHPV